MSLSGHHAAGRNRSRNISLGKKRAASPFLINETENSESSAATGVVTRSRAKRMHTMSHNDTRDDESVVFVGDISDDGSRKENRSKSSSISSASVKRPPAAAAYHDVFAANQSKHMPHKFSSASAFLGLDGGGSSSGVARWMSCGHCGHSCSSVSLHLQQQHHHQPTPQPPHSAPLVFHQSYPQPQFNHPLCCSCSCGQRQQQPQSGGGLMGLDWAGSHQQQQPRSLLHPQLAVSTTQQQQQQCPMMMGHASMQCVNAQQLPLAVTQPNNKYSPYRVPSPDEPLLPAGGGGEPPYLLQQLHAQHKQHLAVDRYLAAKTAFRVQPPSQPQLLKLRHSMPPLPPAGWAEISVVWNLMCWKDQLYQQLHSVELFARHPTIDMHMRTVLLDWLAEVCECYGLHRETYFVAVDLFDRFMSASVLPVRRSQFQLIGTTCLFIAAKLEEIYPPKIDDFAVVTDGACSAEDIKKTELSVMQSVKWALCPMTAVHWLATYLQVLATLPNNQQSASARDIERAVLQQQTTSTVTGCELAVVGGSGQQQQHGTMRSSSSSQQQHARRVLFASPNPHSQLASRRLSGASVDRPDGMTRPVFDRAVFMCVCQLLDLCVLDVEWLRYPYGLLAAAALHLTLQDTTVATRCSGFRAADLCECVSWMRPFALVVNGMAEPATPHKHGWTQADAHNMQTHDVDVKRYEEVTAVRESLRQHGGLHNHL